MIFISQPPYKRLCFPFLIKINVMASSNKQQILTLLVLFYSWFFVSFSQASFEFDAFRPVDSGSVKSFPCLGNLAVCQPYVKGPNIAPAICCKLLKDGIANDTKCLCNVFFYTDVLKSFNITPGELMKLPKDCGIDINLSICKKGFSHLLLFFLFLVLLI